MFFNSLPQCVCNYQAVQSSLHVALRPPGRTVDNRSLLPRNGSRRFGFHVIALTFMPVWFALPVIPRPSPVILLLFSARRKIRLAKTDIVRRPSYPTLYSRRSRLVVENFNSPLVIGDWVALARRLILSIYYGAYCSLLCAFVVKRPFAVILIMVT